MIQTIQLGIPVARIELLDDVQMDAVNQFSKLNYPVKDTLFFEFHGTEAGVKEQAELVQSIARGARRRRVQVGDQERKSATTCGQARHDVTYAATRRCARAAKSGRPMCACRSRASPNASSRPRRISRESFLIAPLVGHVGDGNFHLGFLINRDDPKELAEAERLNDRLVMRALAMDGTCTGEHGIGLGKMKFLDRRTRRSASR